MKEQRHLRLVYSKPMDVERWKRGPWEKRDVPESAHLKEVHPAEPAAPKKKSLWGRRLLVAGIMVSVTVLCRPLGEGKMPRENGGGSSPTASEIDRARADIRKASEEIRRAGQEIRESNRDFAEYMKWQNQDFSEYVERKNREMQQLNRQIRETGEEFEADVEGIGALNRRLEKSVRGLGRESEKLNGSAGRVLKKTEYVQGQQRRILRQLRRLEKQRRATKKPQ